MVWQPSMSTRHTDTPADSEDLPCPVAEILDFLTQLVYPENEPGVFKRVFTAEEVAAAGINRDLIFLQFGRLLRK